MMVDRYDWRDDGMDQSNDGAYVIHDDYVELQDRADALVSAMRFYADENNPDPNSGPWGSSSDDWGYHARIALAQHGSKA